MNSYFKLKFHSTSTKRRLAINSLKSRDNDITRGVRQSSDFQGHDFLTFPVLHKGQIDV